ncbi:hypothetical protein J7L48_11350 [bacterium]|nr:hypothetical protein [bacterium]
MKVMKKTLLISLDIRKKKVNSSISRRGLLFIKILFAMGKIKDRIIKGGAYGY